MKTTDELFLELMQVAVGRLDCLSRAPEPEEWQRLYELSKQHKVEGIAYQGVEHLFEFGLRAPQDVSIDWMSETEMIREANEQWTARQVPVLKYYPQQLQSLRQADEDELKEVRLLTIQHLYKLYRNKRLNMRALNDYYFFLLPTNGMHESLKDGGSSSSPIGPMGMRRFAGGVMWLLQEAFGMKRASMYCNPFEEEGRYLFDDLMGNVGSWQRTTHRLRYQV